MDADAAMLVVSDCQQTALRMLVHLNSNVSLRPINVSRFSIVISMIVEMTKYVNQSRDNAERRSVMAHSARSARVQQTARADSVLM